MSSNKSTNNPKISKISKTSKLYKPVDPREIGFFCNDQEHAQKNQKNELCCSLISIFEEFTDVLKEGNWHPLAYCPECNQQWRIRKNSIFWNSILELVLNERETFKVFQSKVYEGEIEQSEMDDFTFFDRYELKPMTECPTCSLKYFCTQESINRYHDEVATIDSQFREKRVQYHEWCKMRESLEVIWAPLHNRDALIVANQLEI